MLKGHSMAMYGSSPHYLMNYVCINLPACKKQTGTLMRILVSNINPPSDSIELHINKHIDLANPE